MARGWRVDKEHFELSIGSRILSCCSWVSLQDVSIMGKMRWKESASNPSMPLGCMGSVVLDIPVNKGLWCIPDSESSSVHVLDDDLHDMVSKAIRRTMHSPEVMVNRLTSVDHFFWVMMIESVLAFTMALMYQSHALSGSSATCIQHLATILFLSLAETITHFKATPRSMITFQRSAQVSKTFPTARRWRMMDCSCYGASTSVGGVPSGILSLIWPFPSQMRKNRGETRNNSFLQQCAIICMRNHEDFVAAHHHFTMAVQLNATMKRPHPQMKFRIAHLIWKWKGNN